MMPISTAETMHEATNSTIHTTAKSGMGSANAKPVETATAQPDMASAEVAESRGEKFGIPAKDEADGKK